MELRKCILIDVSLHQPIKIYFLRFLNYFHVPLYNHEHCKYQLHSSAITYWYSVTKYTFYKAKMTIILIPFKIKIKKRGLKGKITTFRHKIYISI